MPRPRRTRAAYVGHASLNTIISPDTAVARDPRTTWPSPATLAQYHLSLSDCQAMYKTQGGACAICGTRRDPMGLVIDHNHKTGKVRGLLCSPCNTGLGFMKDSPDVLEAALQYLEERGCYGPNALADEEAS